MTRTRPTISLRLTPKTAVLLAALLAFIAFLSTLQWQINGSTHPYVTDVGEIQNALPRWGTLHFTGYPQYTLIGSIFVTLLRPVLEPAAGASLYSAVWGAVAVGLLCWLALAFDVPPPAAVLTVLLFGLSLSFWVDASIAELHTMTMALTVATLLAAVYFHRSGQARHLYWLAFLAGQGVAHQRAFAFSGLAFLLLALPHWRVVWQKKWAVVGLGLLGPLTYLYLPIPAWLGVEWTFGSPGTWEGFTALLLDTKAERIIAAPQSPAEWQTRLCSVVGLLLDDWPWPLLLTGLIGLVLPGRHATRTERAALTLNWIPYLVLALVIWEGHVSDALLAVKLPVIAMAALGLAFISRRLWQRRAGLGRASVALWVVAAGWLVVRHRAEVLAITRDDGAQEIIALAAAIPPAADGRSQALMAFWGNDYWQLAYAQRYHGRFPHLTLVRHDADFAGILARGDQLLTLSRTFYQRPLSWWQKMVGEEVALSNAAPRVVEIRAEPAVAPPDSGDRFALGNGIAIANADVTWQSPQELVLALDWIATEAPTEDYSVAVHLVAQDPPAGPQDILSQADRTHPVNGWYPTSLWQKNEAVAGRYRLAAPPGAEPVAVRVSMYQRLEDGSFANTEWLTVPVGRDR